MFSESFWVVDIPFLYKILIPTILVFDLQNNSLGKKMKMKCAVEAQSRVVIELITEFFEPANEAPPAVHHGMYL